MTFVHAQEKALTDKVKKETSTVMATKAITPGSSIVALQLHVSVDNCCKNIVHKMWIKNLRYKEKVFMANLTNSPTVDWVAPGLKHLH